MNKRSLKSCVITIALLIATVLSSSAQVNTLHYAIQQGDINRVRELLRDGSDLNKTDKFGNTALSLSTHYGNMEIVKLLAEHGTYIDGVDTHGNTALIIAAIKGEYTIAQYLVQQGAYIDFKGSKDQTALMHAAVNFEKLSNLEMVRLLVNNGADINAQDEYKRTALDYAGNQDIRDYLISQGAIRGKALE